MTVSEGKQLLSDELAEKIVALANDNNWSLYRASIELEISHIPRISNATCFYFSIWSKFTKEELRKFFPLTEKDIKDARNV